MRLKRIIIHRLHSLFRRSRADADLQREIELHFEQLVQEATASGMSEAEARRMAQRQFGPVEKTKEECRDMRRVDLIESFWRDVRYAVRVLAKNRGFAASAILTLSLGIAANTTIFSAVSAILLRKPPVSDPDRLCSVSSKNFKSGYDLVGVSAPDFQSWQEQNTVFEDMAAVERGRSFTLTGKMAPGTVRGDRVTTDYFRVIGIMPVLGRAFLPGEGQAGNDHVVILSNALWRERFGSDPNALGKNLEINAEPYRIVGVAPPRCSDINVSGAQLWTPLVFSSEDMSPSARSNHYINLVLAHLKSGVTIQQAQSEMNSIARRLAQDYPKTNKDWGATVLTLQEYNIRSRDWRNGMTLLMTAVGLVLLVACTNIAGLLLARGTARGHELAIRLAVGANRARLLRQMLAESLVIGAMGGGFGLLLSIWGIRLLRAGFNFNEFASQQAAGFRVDQPTVLFTLVISLLTTILFGLAPAIRASKANPKDALSESGRTGSVGFRRSRLRKILVTAEVALALFLLTAAGVDLREVVREWREPNGFNTQNLLTTNLDVSGRHYKEPASRVMLFQQVTDKLKSLPEVEDASVDSCVPMGCFYSTSFDIVGRPPLAASQRPSAGFFVVGPDYFRTMQIPLMKGRPFSTHDHARAPLVAIVNQEFVRRFFPQGDAIGKQIEMEDGNHLRTQIVGIVGNVNTYVGQINPRPQVYECYLQIPVNAFSTMALVVRSRMTPAALAPLLRSVVWSVDKDQPVGRIQTMEDLVANNLGGDKLMAALMGVFAAFALVLAAVGIYGVMASSVVQRTREMGIRVALGAQGKDVLGLVLREGGLLTGIGCAIGLLLALPLPRLFSGLFNGFAMQGPLIGIAAALTVAFVSLLATYIPAYRAANLPPMAALRHE
jgi:putative ABC transport system permease protein